MKEEPVFEVEKSNLCYMCGGNFLCDIKWSVKAKKVQCRNCGKPEHCTQMCRIKQMEMKTSRAVTSEKVKVVLE